MLLLSSADFCKNKLLKKKSIRKTVRVSSDLDLDHYQRVLSKLFGLPAEKGFVKCLGF